MERKEMDLDRRKEDIAEIMELMKSLSVEDKREVRGVIIGLQMARSA